MEVLTINKWNYPNTVVLMRVGDLDKTKCSTKFLENNIDDETFVYVKCDKDGNLEYRGKKEEYRIYPTSKFELQTK